MYEFRKKPLTVRMSVTLDIKIIAQFTNLPHLPSTLATETLKPIAEYKTDTGRLELKRSFFKNYVKGFETDSVFKSLAYYSVTTLKLTGRGYPYSSRRKGVAHRRKGLIQGRRLGETS